MTARAILAKMRREAQTGAELAVLAAIDKALAATPDPAELVVLGMNLAEARTWAGHGFAGEIVTEHIEVRAKQRAGGRQSFASMRERLAAAALWRDRLAVPPLARLVRDGALAKACQILAKDPVVLDSKVDPPRTGLVSGKTIERTLEWYRAMRDAMPINYERND